jgi:hypothetical protein
VPVDRLLAQAKLARDGLVGVAGCDQAQDLQLACRQPMGMPGRGSPHQGVDPSEIRLGAEVLECRPGSGKLKRSAILVAEGPAGQPNKHTHTSGKVGRLDPLPDIEGMAQHPEGWLRFAAGHVHSSARLRGDRTRHARIEASRKPVQLPAGVARIFDTIRSQHDLDIGGQQSQTFQPVVGGAQDTPDGAGGRTRTALLDAQQC